MGAGRSGYLEEVRQIRWGEVIDGLEGGLELILWMTGGQRSHFRMGVM